MTGAIDTSLTLSPLNEDTPGTNHTPPTDVQSWLAANGMEKYRNALEANGFDCLLFMVRGYMCCMVCD